ncbi:MAG: hypothetical protein E7620_05945 [Ruminococcaceae bacterium]|nr:hypothetical protein [Oscillospiraceae bacterium]
MIGILLKKQLLELFSFLYQDRKNGKKRSKASLIGWCALYLYVAVVMVGAFTLYAYLLCEPLVTVGFGWLYMVIMGMLAMMAGVILGTLSSYSGLFHAGDNDFLLSMPIPTSKILTVRLLVVYCTGAAVEVIAMIPAVILYLIYGNLSAKEILLTCLIPIVLSVLVLALTCVVGFLVALISARVKRKSLIVVLLSLAFLFGYFFFYFKIMEYLPQMLANPDALGNGVKTFLYPLYCMGRAAEGSVFHMLLFIAFTGILFALVVVVLLKTFLRLATAKGGTVTKKAGESAVQSANSLSVTLLKKEMGRFFSCPIYLLNCGLGVIFTLIGGVAVIVKANDVRNMMAMLPGFGINEAEIPLALTAMLFFICSMNFITAPSVSLEGKSLWLLRSFPIPASAVLQAKLGLHLLLTTPVVIFFTVAALAVLGVSIGWWILIMATILLANLFTALWGLFLNLLMPNFQWKDESVPVKQDPPIAIAMFAVWGLVAALVGLYFLARNSLSPMLFMGAVLLLLAVANLLLWNWLRRKGCARFDSFSA